MSSAWGSSWGSAWGNSWGAISPTPTPTLTNEAYGNWNNLGKKKKRKGKVIRYSDFESQDEYAKALAAAMPVIQPSIKAPSPIPIDQEDDDELLLAVVSRLIH